MLGAALKSNRCAKIRRLTECTSSAVSLHHKIVPSSLEAVGCAGSGANGDAPKKCCDDCNWFVFVASLCSLAK